MASSRGVGLQFGTLGDAVGRDPLYAEALSLAPGAHDRRRAQPHEPVPDRAGVSRSNSRQTSSSLAHTRAATPSSSRRCSRNCIRGVGSGRSIRFQACRDGRHRRRPPAERFSRRSTWTNSDAFAQGRASDQPRVRPRPLPGHGRRVLARSGPIALAHIDCDIYSAVVFLRRGEAHMMPGDTSRSTTRAFRAVLARPKPSRNS